MPSTYDWNNYLLINFFYLTSDFALTQKKNTTWKCSNSKFQRLVAVFVLRKIIVTALKFDLRTLNFLQNKVVV